MHDRRDIATALAARIGSEPGTLAVFLVGSSAVRQTLPSSDIDLMAIRNMQASEHEDTIDAGGIEVSVEYLSLRTVHVHFEDAPRSLARLRFAGRIADASTLWQRGGAGAIPERML